MISDSIFLVYLASALLILSYVLVGFGIVKRIAQWSSNSSDKRAIFLAVIFIYLVSAFEVIDIVNDLFHLTS
ncbi:hypothetical protein C9J51_12830 [Photobacterium iliopiscarium]|nr:hypothetical protein UB38_07130 [Photobacterium iliopiscarium]PSU00887.1 hypothetical protein C9I85_05260 [Photobacterium iliopiscarium]PSV82094.1 hypothetical protein C9J51_12830 [Photobacterium iliopiscarium]